jgi:hypothetical protein
LIPINIPLPLLIFIRTGSSQPEAGQPLVEKGELVHSFIYIVGITYIIIADFDFIA